MQFGSTDCQTTHPRQVKIQKKEHRGRRYSIGSECSAVMGVSELHIFQCRLTMDSAIEKPCLGQINCRGPEVETTTRQRTQNAETQLNMRTGIALEALFLTWTTEICSSLCITVRSSDGERAHRCLGRWRKGIGEDLNCARIVQDQIQAWVGLV